MQIAIIGLGSLGRYIATRLSQMDVEVVAIDNDPQVIESIKDDVAHAVTADSTSEKAMRSVGVPDVDAAVIAVGEHIDVSVQTTMLLRKLGVIQIVARAMNKTHEEILKEVGATRVIRLEELSGKEVVKWLTAPDVYQHVSFPGGYTLVEINAPPSLVGKKILETNLREEHGINIVAIQKRTPDLDIQGHSTFRLNTNTTPSPEILITEEDVLVLVGDDEKITTFLKEENKE